MSTNSPEANINSSEINKKATFVLKRLNKIVNKYKDLSMEKKL